MKGYVQKILFGLDVFLCVVIFRDPDVSISSETKLASERAKPPRWATALRWCLDHIQKDHCALAVEHDILRAQTAIKYLQTKQP